MEMANSPIKDTPALPCQDSQGFNIMEHTLIACLNLLHPKQLYMFKYTVINKLSNLLLTRNCVYRKTNFAESDVSELKST